MPSQLDSAVGSTRQQAKVSVRKPDYFIGPSGLPTLTSPSVKMHRPSGFSSSGRAGSDGVRNSKLNKCLYNTAIRNGGARAPAGTGVGHTGAIIDGSSRRSCKTENDITAIKSSTTGRYSKSPSPSTATTLSLAAGCPPRGGSLRGCTATDATRSTGSPGGLASPMTSSRWRSFGVSDTGNQLQKFSPPPRLLSTRGTIMQRTSSPSTTSNRHQGGQPRASQQCRYSSIHKQLDNRLTYQRSYDRNIFGYDQRMDQFVLPPLQS